MISEFKEFAMKGNLVDMAVAVVMGGAFGKVVSSFIDGMVMPTVGMLTGGTDFNSMKMILKEGVAEIKDPSGAVITPAVTEVAVKYGTFITVAIEFLIVALVMFLVIKAVNNMKKAQVPPPAGPTPDQTLLTEIRDLLKK